MSNTSDALQALLNVVVEAVTASNTPPVGGLIVDADTHAELISRARVEREMSNRELARRTNISELKLEWYQRHGETFWKPTFDELIAIKSALDIHPASVRKFL